MNATPSAISSPGNGGGVVATFATIVRALVCIDCQSSTAARTSSSTRVMSIASASMAAVSVVRSTSTWMNDSSRRVFEPSAAKPESAPSAARSTATIG